MADRLEDKFFISKSQLGYRARCTCGWQSGWVHSLSRRAEADFLFHKAHWGPGYRLVNSS